VPGSTPFKATINADFSYLDARNIWGQCGKQRISRPNQGSPIGHPLRAGRGSLLLRPVSQGIAVVFA
jgi:hypothetical protein